MVGVAGAKERPERNKLRDSGATDSGRIVVLVDRGRTVELEKESVGWAGTLAGGKKGEGTQPVGPGMTEEVSTGTEAVGVKVGVEMEVEGYVVDSKEIPGRKRKTMAEGGGGGGEAVAGGE
jgi:hypothetical protein